MKWFDVLRREPVRAYIYSISVAVIALLVFYGVVTAAAVPIITGVIIAALAFPSPVEMLRNRVSPVTEDTKVGLNEERQ